MTAPPELIPQNLPPEGFPQAQQPTFIIQTPVYGDVPVQTVCPNCHQSICTSVKKVEGTCTWIWCFVLFLCCIPCCCIPFVTDCSKDTQHSCPSCGSLVGVSKA